MNIVLIFVQPQETDILSYNGLKRIGFYFSYTKKSGSIGLVTRKCEDPSSLQCSWPFSVSCWFIVARRLPYL